MHNGYTNYALQGMLFVHLAITVQIFVQTTVAIRKLWDFKHLLMSQNLQTNMEGAFYWASHIAIVNKLNY